MLDNHVWLASFHDKKNNNGGGDDGGGGGDDDEDDSNNNTSGSITRLIQHFLVEKNVFQRVLVKEHS